MASGSMILIKEQTASSSASVEFVDGSGGVVLDSTYPIYKFELINMHPASDDQNFRINFSADGGSNYNVTKTTTGFIAEHGENGSGASLSYNTFLDLAQSTGVQSIGYNVGNGNDECLSGTLHLFNPSSTTFVKHFIVKTNVYDNSDVTRNVFVAGYCNTTSAVDSIKFTMSSGNIDSGTIKLYGIKDS